MARFTLVVTPEGHAVLACRDELNDLERIALAALLEELDAKRLVVIGECDVVQVRSIDINLGPSPAEVRHERLLEGAQA